MAVSVVTGVLCVVLRNLKTGVQPALHVRTEVETVEAIVREAEFGVPW